MDKKKSIVLFIVILLIILLMGAGTYAYWTWNSNVNKNVVFNTAGMEDMIVYNEGNSYFVGNFMPTDTFCEGANNTISFYKKEEAADIDFVATVNMDINSIGPNIANSNDVYWVVTEGDNTITCDVGLSSASVISYGTFNGKNAGNSITLLSDVVVTTSVQYFTVWIWIDSSGTNLNLLSGETIDTNIWTQIDMVEGIDLSPEAPVLDDGMVPVTISADGVATTVAENDLSWYDYENKEWANVVLVNKDATANVIGSHSREYYKNNPGTPVVESDILAYYVWIPRYKYAFPKADGNPEEISIVFESEDAVITTGTATGTSYYTHPAFIWDGETVAGIWVGKFETGHSSLSSSTTSNNLGCSDENCTNADGLIIKPNVQSLIYNNVSNMFYVSRSMTRSTNPFGLNASSTDTHMMKNSEWGAVAYLSHSKYGINQEIYINNSSSYYTGRSGGGNTSSSSYGIYTWTGQEIDASGTIGGYASDRTLGTNASTTGNVTGVYDMSGGAWEYVMGNYGNTIGSSGFSTLPGSKYYDLYSGTQFTGDYSTNMGLCTLETCGGHALNETKNWYRDTANFVDSGGTWFVRGGGYDSGSYAGAFFLGSVAGNARNYYSWRSVLVASIVSSESSSCIIYYESGLSGTTLGTQEITEGEPFELMNFDGNYLSLDQLNCYAPGTSMTLPCSTVVYVDDAKYSFCG